MVIKKWMIQGILLFLCFMTSSINVFGAETDERGGKEYIEQTLEESGLSFEEIEKALENSSLQDTLSFDEIIRKLWRNGRSIRQTGKYDKGQSVF